MKEIVADLQERFAGSSIEELLEYFLKGYGNRIALASSLGVEDQVLTDLVLKVKPDARIFVLDTGRLPQETYATLTATRKHYGRNFEVYFPDTAAVEKMESEMGPDFFYESVTNRLYCCNVRKVQPLKRVLGTLDVWITGLRREQAPTRTGLQRIEWDETNGLLKLNPLIDWNTQQVWDYIRDHQIPYNPLHDQNYPSIGCAPCTRPVAPGGDLRSGRWWWEEPEHKECGLHFHHGKLIRRNAHESTGEAGESKHLYPA